MAGQAVAGVVASTWLTRIVQRRSGFSAGAAELPNLAFVETVSSAKLASALDRAWAGRAAKLAVFVQVNTSGEDSMRTARAAASDPASDQTLVRHL